MLKVNDIFESISGEAGGFPQGTWVTFIRLQGCNLRCEWCDTPQAQSKNGSCGKMRIPRILQMTGNGHVLITGGEPLIQEKTVKLIKELLKHGNPVQVETNGSISIPSIPCFNQPSLHWVIDRKCPSSGMHEKMIPLDDFSRQIRQIRRDGGFVYLKWVVANNEDTNFAIREMQELANNDTTPPFIISPIDANGRAIPHIVEKIREENPALQENIIFSVQLHKIFKLP